MTTKNKELKKQIEKERFSLHEIQQQKGSLKDKEVVELSKNLDKLITRFYQQLEDV